MNRRNFLKTTGTTGLISLISSASFAKTLSSKGSFSLEEAFRNPSNTSKAYTWWHWMNGHVSKEGITLDLEAMKNAGLGGFQLFEAGTGIPKGKVESLSDEWLELMRHTIAESDRLGLEFAMHNCPGWSSSGGPWITPDLSMQQMTWSESHVVGGKSLSISLPQPPSKLNYYKDAHVIAFPSLEGEGVSLLTNLRKISSSQGDISLEIVTNYIKDGINLLIPKNESKSYLLFEFMQEVALASIALNTSANGGEAKLFLEYSNDGINFSSIAQIHGGGDNGERKGDEFTYINFPLTRGKYFRLTANTNRHFSAIWFAGTHRFHDWMRKANFNNVPFQVNNKNNFTDYQSIKLNSIVDLTPYVNEEGILNWNAPAGNWTILRIGHTATGQYNHSAPSAGAGLDCDKFSTKAIDTHFNEMFKKLLPILKPLAQKGKVGLLIDSYEMGLQNWTANFAKEFSTRRKYDLISFLPAMTGRLVEDENTTEGFLFDVRKTQSELMADNYYSRFATLCKEQGIISYTEPYDPGNFVEMEVGKRLDINMGEFWAGISVLWPNKGMRRTIKLASSIAHIQGEKIVGAEAYTAEPNSGKWQQYPYAMKSLGDWAFTKGLTRLIFHRFAHQPHPTAVPGMTMGPWGIHFDRTNTWWKPAKEWLSYVARTQSLLQQGTFVADIVYYTGEDVPARTITEDELSPSLPEGYDYDLLDKSTLLHDTSLKNGRLQLTKGTSYAVLVLPEKAGISLEVLQKIEVLVSKGLSVIGSAPKFLLGLNGEQNNIKFKILVEQLWGTNSAGKTIERAHGLGKIYQGVSLEKVLKEKHIKPDFEYSSTKIGSAINYIHRKVNNTDVYFIANRKRSAENIVCTFRSTLQPEHWNPLTNTITPLDFYEVVDDRMRIPLQLGPAGSLFIVCRNKPATTQWKSLKKDGISLLSTKNFTQLFTETIYPKSHFSIAFWVKPEIDIALSKDEFFGLEKTDHFAIFPSILKNTHEASVGLTIGRNGIVVFERTNNEFQDVLVVPLGISGWSHLALVYQNNTPMLYLNGEKVSQGVTSLRTVHASFNDVPQKDGASYYNGEMTEPKIIDKALTNAAINDLFLAGLPDVEKTLFTNQGKGKLLLWENGRYQLEGGKSKTIEITNLSKPIALKGPWKIDFQKDRGAPEAIILNELHSLHLHEESGVKYFSGTASYQMKFNFAKLQANQKAILDLGRVEVIAEIYLNDQSLGTLWKPPFQIDLSNYLLSGTNKLVVKVTNLWPNRLIGDERQNDSNDNYWTGTTDNKYAKLLWIGGIKALPEWYTKGLEKPKDGRITFTTWQHYHKNDPLLASGLLGPVSIHTVQEVAL